MSVTLGELRLVNIDSSFAGNDLGRHVGSFSTFQLFSRQILLIWMRELNEDCAIKVENHEPHMTQVPLIRSWKLAGICAGLLQHIGFYFRFFFDY